MEHSFESLLHPQLAIHSVLDDASVCAHERKGEGMEIRGCVFGRQCGRGASVDVDF